MPKNRAGRFVYALLTIALLLVIGRNVYRRVLNNRLMDAVQARDVTAVENLLARGAEANSRLPVSRKYRGGMSALELVMSYAADARNDDIAQLLVQHHATANMSAAEINHCLLVACQHGSPALTRLLLEHGANANAGGSYGNNAIDEAIGYAGNVATPNSSSAAWSEQQRLQVEADKKRHLGASREIIGLLLLHGAKLSLWQAAQTDDVTTLRVLLDAGTPMDATRPLNPLPASDKTSVVKGPTALALAAGAGNLNAVRLLLDRGATVNDRSGGASSALIYAIQQGHLETARLLVRRGAGVNGGENTPSQPYNTPLVSACVYLPELVPELLQRGADVKTAGSRALIAAMSHPDLVRLLLQHGARFEGKQGHEVLVAAIEHQPDLVPLLLAQGADARETGDTPAQLIAQAVRYKRKNLIAPLLRAGANLQSHAIFRSDSAPHSRINMAYSTPLIEAIPQGADIVELLLKLGAEPNATSWKGETPLIIAAYSGNADATRLLLAHGAKADEEGKMRHTPLYFARRHKCADVAALLEQAGGHEH